MPSVGPTAVASCNGYNIFRQLHATCNILGSFNAATSLICFILICTPALSQTLSGKVVNIANGDTITILDGSKRQQKIRLYGIDTPEKGQAYGKAAKRHTTSLVARKQVQVNAYDTDKYGRTVGVVYVNGVNVNESLIEAGCAWQYRKYCWASFCDDWLQLEQEAKLSRIGLWADADPVPPWSWRRGVRNNSSAKNAGGKYTPVASGYHGNVKSYVFHGPDCRHYDCKNCVKDFSSRHEAVDSGDRPCGTCKP